MIGIRTFYRKLADQIIASNALVTVGLTSPIGKGQKQNFRAWIPFNIGATGGAQFQVVVPAGGVAYKVSIAIFDTQTPAVDTNMQVASAPFGKALANAGDYWAEITGYVANGVTAGVVDIQVAQNTTDAATLTVYEGGSMDVQVL